MKKSITGALLVAGVLALSACGSPEEAAEPAPAGTTSSAASATPSATPTLAVGQEQYTPDELEAALTTVKADQGLTGAIANDASLRPQLQGATDALGDITITPEACSDLALSNISEKMDSATFAILQLSATDSVTILSYDDASFIDQQIASNELQMKDCKEFQMETAGQVFTSTSEAVDASTQAVTTQGFSVSTTAAGQVTEALSVSAFSGTTNITVAMQGPADDAAALARAEALIDQILAELEQ